MERDLEILTNNYNPLKWPVTKRTLAVKRWHMVPLGKNYSKSAKSICQIYLYTHDLHEIRLASSASFDGKKELTGVHLRLKQVLNALCDRRESLYDVEYEYPLDDGEAAKKHGFSKTRLYFFAKKSITRCLEFFIWYHVS
jgi:hypothetical protein